MKAFCLLIVMFFAVQGISAARAGQCIPQEISPEYIEATDLIFEGHLSDHTSEIARVPASQETLTDHFTITKLWKGDASGDITIVQGVYHGRGFYSGKKYLIFASKSSDATYSTSGCELIVEISDETPYEITFLESYLKKEEKE